MEDKEGGDEGGEGGKGAVIEVKKGGEGNDPSSRASTSTSVGTTCDERDDEISHVVRHRRLCGRRRRC